MYTPTMLLAILPEILLLVLSVLLMAVEPFWKEEKRRNSGWLTAGGLLATLVISLLFARPGAPQAVLGGMVRFDWFGFFLKMLLLFSAGMTALLMMDHEKLGNRGEAYTLLLVTTIGMCLMVSSGDLVMLYLAIETTSIPLYVLAGFMLDDKASSEAGLKYLLFGAMTSAIMLYGFSLLYGFAGTTDIYKLAGTIMAAPNNFLLIIGVLFLILVGLGFKISAVPFHFWAPDVYQGAPTPVAGFLSTASKAAGFAVVLRLFAAAFPDFSPSWQMILAVLSVLSMTIGNLLAMAQTNIKRLLAYSSIAHAGYALIGVVTFSQLGTLSTVFYLAAYILTNLAAFGIVTAFSRIAGSDELKDYAGMSRRSPWLGIAMLVAFLSLAGMPPFGGFVGKVLVFTAAIQNPAWTWLAVVGIINSIVGLYYYLNVLKYVYLYRMEGENEEKYPLPLTRPYAIALVALSLGIVLIGTMFGPWYDWALAAAQNLF
jgi:NADH-quinone oxidoreductase subunit N